MAIAVFTDIHGNLEALQAILKDIRKKRRHIKEVYFLGDAVTFGSDSSACLKLLQKHNVNCVVGNHEQRLFRYDKTLIKMTPAGLSHMKYIFDGLDNDDIRFIKEMPLSRTLDLKGYRIYFSHYCHDENGIVHEDMDYFHEEALDEIFKNNDCDAVFMGHLHKRKIYIRNNQRSYFCLDSSGCVHDNITNYTFFDIGEQAHNNFDIYRIDVKFDRAKFVKKMCERDIPEKANFAKEFFGIDFENPADDKNGVDASKFPDIAVTQPVD
jgi:predicted phosphodiesterase